MLLIDGHVHIYDCFDLETFLDSAYRNVKAEAGRLGNGRSFTGILLLAETSRDDWFEHLFGYSGGGELPHSKKAGGWSFHRTGDDCCLEVRLGDAQRLFLIAGRQIVTAEGLEVLALITRSSFNDGLLTETAIRLILERGALPVIPWGFGKWTGSRGQLLDEIISSAPGGRFFLGDNGGRAKFLGEPSHFRKGLEKGFRILPGSDPLPFSFEQGRAGSFGFVIQERISEEHPAQDLIESLRQPGVKVIPYGKLEKLPLFSFKQIAMQVKKRARRLRSQEARRP